MLPLPTFFLELLLLLKRNVRVFRYLLLIFSLFSCILFIIYVYIIFFLLRFLSPRCVKLRERLETPDGGRYFPINISLFS